MIGDKQTMPKSLRRSTKELVNNPGLPYLIVTPAASVSASNLLLAAVPRLSEVIPPTEIGPIILISQFS